MQKILVFLSLSIISQNPEAWAVIRPSPVDMVPMEVCGTASPEVYRIRSRELTLVIPMPVVQRTTMGELLISPLEPQTENVAPEKRIVSLIPDPDSFNTSRVEILLSSEISVHLILHLGGNGIPEECYETYVGVSGTQIGNPGTGDDGSFGPGPLNAGPDMGGNVTGSAPVITQSLTPGACAAIRDGESSLYYSFLPLLLLAMFICRTLRVKRADS